MCHTYAFHRHNSRTDRCSPCAAHVHRCAAIDVPPPAGATRDFDADGLSYLVVVAEEAVPILQLLKQDRDRTSTSYRMVRTNMLGDPPAMGSA
jgi:hypothetical protein